MIAIDRYKKSLSCIMAVFTMMSLRMNLLNDMFILLYVKRNSEV